MGSLILASALLAIVACERVPRLRYERASLLRRHSGSDLVYLATGALGLGLLLREAGLRASLALGTLLPSLAALPAPVSFVLALVLYDLGEYMLHHLLHRSATLWRFHEIHHSSRQLDWLATFRGHVVEHALRHLVSTVALLLIGFPLYAVAAAAAFYTAWAALNHANLRIDLGFLEPLFVTPRLHRLHHVTGSSERNLGTIFSLWDRLRGNLLSDAAAPLEPLGVPGDVEGYPQTWLAQLVEPWRGEPPRPGLREAR